MCFNPFDSALALRSSDSAAFGEIPNTVAELLTLASVRSPTTDGATKVSTSKPDQARIIVADYNRRHLTTHLNRADLEANPLTIDETENLYQKTFKEFYGRLEAIIKKLSLSTQESQLFKCLVTVSIELSKKIEIDFNDRVKDDPKLHLRNSGDRHEMAHPMDVMIVWLTRYSKNTTSNSSPVNTLQDKILIGAIAAALHDAKEAWPVNNLPEFNKLVSKVLTESGCPTHIIKLSLITIDLLSSIPNSERITPELIGAEKDQRLKKGEKYEARLYYHDQNYQKGDAELDLALEIAAEIKACDLIVNGCDRMDGMLKVFEKLDSYLSCLKRNKDRDNHVLNAEKRADYEAKVKDLSEKAEKHYFTSRAYCFLAIAMKEYSFLSKPFKKLLEAAITVNQAVLEIYSAHQEKLTN
jgi:hypothetical protein